MKLKRTLFTGGVGALLAFFFDPQNGNRRRKMAVDRIAGFFRRKGRESAKLARGVAAEAYGVSQKVTHLKEEEKPQPNDATLAQKVETEIFRDADVPKGQINVNAEDGVVVLRGQVDEPDLIKELEKKTRKVQGVKDVQNLLHVPGEEVPAGS
jgi:osmotically-inducible protein OsmY